MFADFQIKGKTMEFLAQTRGKKILEKLSKPRIFTEFENRALFSPAT